MGNVLLGLVFDIFAALCGALNTLFLIFLYLASTSTTIIKIDQMVNNIYILVSIIMIFYITINLLTYLANPDKLADKTSGGTKLLVKIVITLTLLVFTPTLFSLSRDLQTAVLKENILGKIILSTGEEMDDEKFLGTSQMISRVFVESFVTPLNDDGTLQDTMFMQRQTTSMQEIKDLVEDSKNYDFNWVMALVAPTVLCLLFFGFLFDLAVRIIKLSFMEIIAPAPIICYPFDKKNSVFSKWLKDTLSTYLSMFIRLALVYFAIFIIRQIGNGDTSEMLNTANPVLKTFLIIGALLFIKQLPQLISDIFGIKMDGNFTLNPMARIREIPLLGSATQAAGAALGGAVTGAALGFRAAGGFRGVGTAFKEGFSGLGGTFRESGFKEGMKQIGTGLGGGFGAIGNSIRRGTPQATRLASRGALYGGRAGWNQTSIMGKAVKDQKVDKTGYRAGASSVAQAITGDSSASAGIVESMFNRVGTELNDPMYQQSKAISDADKEVDKAVAEYNTYKDSEREIASQLGVAEAAYSPYATKISGIRKEIGQAQARYDTLKANYEKYDQNMDSIIDSRTKELDTKISINRQRWQNKVSEIEGNTKMHISSIVNSRQDRIDNVTVEERANLEYANMMISNTEVGSAEHTEWVEKREEIQNQINSKVRVVDNEITSEINTLRSQTEQQYDTMEKEFINEDTRLRYEKNNIENIVAAEAVEAENAFKSFDYDIEGKTQELSRLEAEAQPHKVKYEELHRQHEVVAKEVTVKEKAVTDARTKRNELKDLKKYTEGEFHKNK